MRDQSEIANTSLPCENTKIDLDIWLIVICAIMRHCARTAIAQFLLHDRDACWEP